MTREELQKYLWITPVLAGIIFIVGTLTSYISYKKYYENGLSDLKSRAETIAHTIDEEKIIALQGDESDTLKPEYQDLKKKFMSIIESNADTRFVYLMNKRNGELYFILDSEPEDSPDYSPPGQIYFEESIAIEDALNKYVSSIEGPVTDRWGTWITGVAPVFDKDGNVIAALGMDIDAFDYQRNAFTRASIILFATLIIVLILLFEYRVRLKEKKIIEMRSQFLAVASHEIRSPLSGIAWALDSLIDTKNTSPEVKSFITDIKVKTNELIQTVNDILDAFSLDFRNKDVSKHLVSLSDPLNTALNSLEYLQRSKKIFIKRSSIMPTDAYVLGDQKQLSELFSNIISNAFKYSHEGGEVEIGYERGRKHHHIIIKDCGVGIPKEELKKVFGGFYRATNAKDLKIQGSGLGLFLVTKILDFHKGHILVDSDLGKGTTVTIKLPIEKK